MAKNSDIVARLRLNADDYNAKLEKAKQSTRNFGKSGSTAMGGLLDSFKKLLPAITAAAAAQQSFQRIIGSSQTIGDAYTRTIEAAKASVDEFFYALGSGDFSGFNRGLMEVIRNAKEAATALDQLSNTQMAYDFMTSENMATFRNALTIAKDKGKGMGERQEALGVAEGVLKTMEEHTDNLMNQVVGTISKVVASKSNVLGAEDISIEDLKRIISVDLAGNPALEREKLAARYKEYLRRTAEEVDPYSNEFSYTQAWSQGGQQAVRNTKYDPDRAANALKNLNEEFKDAIIYNAALEKADDEWLRNLLDTYSKAQNIYRALSEPKMGILEARASLNAGTKTPKLTAAQQAQFNYSDPNYYFGLGAKDWATPRDIHDVEAIDDPYIYEMDEALPEVQKELEKTATWADTATTAIDALSSAMGSLSGVVGEDAGAWLQWGTNLLQVIAQAIPSIAALTTANTAKAASDATGATAATANAAATTAKAAADATAATAATANAAAEGAGAVAGIPVAGPALAVAAVASIVAALAAVPKFAHGGIVPGASMTGDNMLIRANSGEMVLTRQQQNLLASRLDNGGNRVEFVIKGSNLVGILNGQNKLNSRNYGG